MRTGCSAWSETDPEAPKHQGISFVLLNMDAPGVTVKPIEMINGASPFCQTFLDDVQVPKSQLVHKVNHGWEVAKRLLQHERSGLDSLTSAESAGPMERIQPELSLPDLARYYDIASVPDISSDRIQDDALRAELVLLEMQKQALQLTRRRTVQETEAQTPGPCQLHIQIC